MGGMIRCVVSITGKGCGSFLFQSVCAWEENTKISDITDLRKLNSWLGKQVIFRNVRSVWAPAGVKV